MALSMVLSYVTPGGAVVGQTENFLVAITNTGSSAVTLTTLVSSSEVGVTVGQPSYLIPNVPIGLGNPVINAGATSNYVFQCVFNSPAGSGPSPNNPGGADPFPDAQTPDPFFTVQIQAQSSDGSVSSASLLVPVLSAIAPFPFPQGGAFQFYQGANIINLIMLGAL